MSQAAAPPQALADSRYAWLRLSVTLLLMTIGSSAMYVVPVVLPTVQSEFGVLRSEASLPYTLLMVGLGFGGILMGRLADRYGVVVPLWIGAAGLTLGFVAATLSPNILVFALSHGVLLGLLGCSATFAPLVADTSLWFIRRRGIAVAICASGNYLAGTVWPPVVQAITDAYSWRTAYLVLAVISGLCIPVLSMALRARPPALSPPTANTSPEAAGTAATPSVAGQAQPSSQPFGLPVTTAQALLCVAGLSCCVAMAMPQVHIVAYCTDLGFGAARGAQMLSLMLAFGIASRLISGAICDRIGGLRTLLLGSVLQGLALLLFIPFDGLVSLYVISALFGLFQGGIVPSYAIIVREYFPSAEAGQRLGVVLLSTMFGMALGGWMSGKVFDLTGSYDAAFANGLAWNLLNLSIVLWLWRRSKRSVKP